MQDVGGCGVRGAGEDVGGGEAADCAGQEDGADPGADDGGGIAGEGGGGTGSGGEVEGEEVDEGVGGDEEDGCAEGYWRWVCGWAGGLVSWSSHET